MVGWVLLAASFSSNKKVGRQGSVEANNIMNEEDYFLAAEMRGRRPEMEDAHVIFFGIDSHNSSEPAREACMFGVFDGHGKIKKEQTAAYSINRRRCKFDFFSFFLSLTLVFVETIQQECARFCSQQLCKEVYSHPFFMEDPVRALEESFVHIDHQYNVLAKQLDIQDGSTATLLLLQCDAQGKKIKYFLAMAGDSRAVLISNSGAVTCLVEDHVSARVDEQERVVREGGKVLYDEDSDIYRVSSMNGEGGLAVTRAIGDASFKVSPLLCCVRTCN